MDKIFSIFNKLFGDFFNSSFVEFLNIRDFFIETLIEGLHFGPCTRKVLLRVLQSTSEVYIFKCETKGQHGKCYYEAPK